MSPSPAPPPSRRRMRRIEATSPTKCGGGRVGVSPRLAVPDPTHGHQSSRPGSADDAFQPRSCENGAAHRASQRNGPALMKQHDRIVRDPKVMLGKPVIRGTRITVEHILRELGGGLPPEEIIAGHPHLTLEDIRAAQAYAADYMADEEVAYG